MIQPIYVIRPFDPVVAIIVGVIFGRDHIRLRCCGRAHLEPVASMIS